MELHRFEEGRRTASTKSGEISYIETGTETQPAALFVHGIGTNAYLWRNVLGPLAEVRRCIALDLPLHGRTPVAAGQDLSIGAMATVLGDFCDALGLTSIDLVANDTGGAVSQVFAARTPGLLATLTLTNCDTADNFPPEAFKPTVELAAAGVLAPAAVALMDDLDAARDAAFGQAYEHLDQVDPDVVRAYLEPCFGTLERARAFERLVTSIDPRDLKAVEPQLRELRVPTLLVWGTEDPFFGISWAYWLRDTIPGVTQLVTIEGGKLFFPEERAAELVPHLARHWADHPRQPGRPSG
jgi:pimeloyl-ACP methyl ester carboxylesterase